jgi:ATP-binding cassette, subfamily B, bacterial
MTTNHAPLQTPMSTARFTLGMIRAQKWRFLGNMLSFILFSLSWLVPGFAAQQFFDLLSGQAPATRSLWTVVAMLVGGQLLHIVGLTGIMSTNVPFQYRSATFLHKNLLARILELPGAAALPETPGAAIGRVRDDVNELSWFPLWLNDMIGFAVLAIVALSAMIRISPLVTLISLVPLIGLMFIAKRTSHRIEKYREATQAAGSRVTSFIAEIFGAVQAVQVARAEDAIVDHFAQLNETRRQAALIRPAL